MDCNFEWQAIPNGGRDKRTNDAWGDWAYGPFGGIPKLFQLESHSESKVIPKPFRLESFRGHQERNVIRNGWRFRMEDFARVDFDETAFPKEIVTQAWPSRVESHSEQIRKNTL